MGNCCSGRRGGKLLVEDCLTLDLAWLMRLGPIREGQAGGGTVKWFIDGTPVGALRFRLDLRTVESARLALAYNLTDGDGEGKPVRQIIALTALPQHLGGRRWWMRCPITRERTRTLHLPPGAERFASRKAWGLVYRVERLSRFNRPFEKLCRAQRRIGSAQGLGTGLERPKGMWRQTFARHIAVLEQRDLACVEQIAAFIKKA